MSSEAEIFSFLFFIQPRSGFFGGTPGGPEILVVFLALLLLFGAKKLPHIARNLGRSIEEFRRAARDVTDEIMHATDAPPPEEPKQLNTPTSNPEEANEDVEAGKD